MAPGNATRAVVDPVEIGRFAAMADHWWDPDGEAAALHRLNPTRLAYIRDRCCAHFQRDPRAKRPLAGLRALDVGCGGGLLCEPLTRLGAEVVGIDPAAVSIEVARAHAAQSALVIDYRTTTADELGGTGTRFDVVLSLEVIEHVPDPEHLTMACANLVAPGGALVLSTLNRNPRSFLSAIVVAEYVLGWLPRGTHRWDRFLRPSELARYVRGAGMRVRDLTGLGYAGGEWRLSTDVGVNYLAFAIKD